MLVCLNCGELLNKKWQRKFCCWDCKITFEAQDKSLAPLSRLSYSVGAPRKKVVVKKRVVTEWIPLSVALDRVKADDEFWGRAKQRFTVSYNDELTPYTKRKLIDLISKFKALRKG